MNDTSLDATRRCYVDDEFKPPCNAFARWAFGTPQISALTLCDCFLESEQGRCKNFSRFPRHLPAPKKHIYQFLFPKQPTSKQRVMVALLPSPLRTALTSWGEELSLPRLFADLGKQRGLSYSDQNFHSYVFILKPVHPQRSSLRAACFCSVIVTVRGTSAQAEQVCTQISY